MFMCRSAPLTGNNSKLLLLRDTLVIFAIAIRERIMTVAALSFQKVNFNFKIIKVSFFHL